jgi:hypothetical protein
MALCDLGQRSNEFRLPPQAEVRATGLASLAPQDGPDIRIRVFRSFGFPPASCGREVSERNFVFPFFLDRRLNRHRDV